MIILDTRIGIEHADRSLVEMARSFGATRAQLYRHVLVLSALPEILAGVRLGAIRGVKGVALVVVVFLFAFAVSEAIAAVERRVDYYAGAR